MKISNLPIGSLVLSNRDVEDRPSWRVAEGCGKELAYSSHRRVEDRVCVRHLITNGGDEATHYCYSQLDEISDEYYKAVTTGEEKPEENGNEKIVCDTLILRGDSVWLASKIEESDIEGYFRAKVTCVVLRGKIFLERPDHYYSVFPYNEVTLAPLEKDEEF